MQNIARNEVAQILDQFIFSPRRCAGPLRGLEFASLDRTFVEDAGGQDVPLGGSGRQPQGHLVCNGDRVPF